MAVAALAVRTARPTALEPAAAHIVVDPAALRHHGPDALKLPPADEGMGLRLRRVFDLTQGTELGHDDR